MSRPCPRLSGGALALLLAFLVPSRGASDGADPGCGLARPRHSRSEPLVFPDSNKVNCHRDRTIVEDPAFFGGEFRSDTGRLTTRWLDGGQVHYTAVLAEPGCTAMVQGTAKVAADGLTATDGATKLAFTDGGVDLTLGSGACAGLSEELFFDHGGSILAEPDDDGSGCDLEVTGMDKEQFIRFYYAFKRALIKGDRQAVAGMVEYPPTAHGLKDLPIRLKGPADLVSHYADVFPECVRQAVLQEKISRIFCRDQGVMFGTGEIWIAGFLPKGKPKDGLWSPKIITINAAACPAPALPASKTGSITIDRAMDVLLALPEIKTWKAYVRRVSKGALHGTILVESEEPVLVKGRKYWSLSFIEDHPDHVHRWELFLVSLDGKTVLIDDAASGKRLTLAQWRKQQHPMDRAKP